VICPCRHVLFFSFLGSFLRSRRNRHPSQKPVEKFLQPGAQIEDRRLAHCVVSAFGDHLKQKVVPHWPSFLLVALQDIMSGKAGVRTPACYSSSFLVREAAFAPYASDTATKLAQVLTQTRAGGNKKYARLLYRFLI